MRNIAEIPELNKLTDTITAIICGTRDKYLDKCEEYKMAMALQNAETDTYKGIKTKFDAISRILEITIGSAQINYVHADNPGLPAFVIGLNTYLGEFDLQGWVLDNGRIGLNYYQGKDQIMTKFLNCMIKHAEENGYEISLSSMKEPHMTSIHSTRKEVPIPAQS